MLAFRWFREDLLLRHVTLEIPPGCRGSEEIIDQG